MRQDDLDTLRGKARELLVLMARRVDVHEASYRNFRSDDFDVADVAQLSAELAFGAQFLWFLGARGSQLGRTDVAGVSRRMLDAAFKFAEPGEGSWFVIEASSAQDAPQVRQINEAAARRALADGPLYVRRGGAVYRQGRQIGSAAVRVSALRAVANISIRLSGAPGEEISRSDALAMASLASEHASRTMGTLWMPGIQEVELNGRRLQDCFPDLALVSPRCEEVYGSDEKVRALIEADERWMPYSTDWWVRGIGGYEVTIRGTCGEWQVYERSNGEVVGCVSSRATLGLALGLANMRASHAMEYIEEPEAQSFAGDRRRG